MKKLRFTVGIAYEEGFTLHIDAESQEAAEAKALEIVEEWASVDCGEYRTDTVHRDYFTV